MKMQRNEICGPRSSSGPEIGCWGQHLVLLWQLHRRDHTSLNAESNKLQIYAAGTFCTKEMSDPGGTSAPLMFALVTKLSFAKVKAVCVYPAVIKTCWR